MAEQQNLQERIEQARAARDLLADLEHKAQSLPGLQKQQSLEQRQERAAAEMAMVQDACAATVGKSKPLLASWRGDFAQLVTQTARQVVELSDRLAHIDGALYAGVDGLKSAIRAEQTAALGEKGDVRSLCNASLAMSQRYGQLASSLGLFDPGLAPFPTISGDNHALAMALMQAIAGRVRVYEPAMMQRAGLL